MWMGIWTIAGLPKLAPGVNLHFFTALAAASASGVAPRSHNGNIMNEAIGADHNCGIYSGIDLCLPSFFRTFGVGCVGRNRRLVDTGLRVLCGTRFQERLRILGRS